MTNKNNSLEKQEKCGKNIQKKRKKKHEKINVQYLQYEKHDTKKERQI